MGYMKLAKSSIFLSAFIVLIFILGIYLGTKYNSSKKPEEVAETSPTTDTEKPALIIDKSLSIDKTYTAPDKYTIFKVTYPQFKNVSADFNQKIADLVTAGIALQKKDSEENWKARYETRSSGDNITEFPKEADKFYFDVSWEPTQENNDFISFILTISAYEGGAHGYETLTSFNYDVVNKKEISLADLFPNDPNYLKTISDFSRKNLTAQFREKLSIKTKADEANFKDSVLPMLESGTTPDEINFSVFTFTDDKITFYFNQYQVAPYAMGGSSVTMSRK